MAESTISVVIAVSRTVNTSWIRSPDFYSFCFRYLNLFRIRKGLSWRLHEIPSQDYERMRFCAKCASDEARNSHGGRSEVAARGYTYIGNGDNVSTYVCYSHFCLHL